MSIVIVRQQETAKAVERAARRFLRPVAQAAGERLALLGLPAPEPVPEPSGAVAALDDVPVVVPDLENFQRFAALLLKSARERLEAANRAHLDELDNDRLRRELRDLAVRQAREQLLATRRALEGAVGTTQAQEILGIDGVTPDTPPLLLERLADAASRLAEPGRALPAVDLRGLAVDWVELRAGLDEAHGRLAQALEEVGDDLLDRAVTLEERDEALRIFREVYVGTTRMLDGLYVALGKRSFAGRLRPTVRSRPGSPGDELPEDPLPNPDELPDGPFPEAPGPDGPPDGPPPGVPPVEPPANEDAAPAAAAVESPAEPAFEAAEEVRR